MVRRTRPPFASAEVLREADAVGARYGQRPSTLLGVADPYAAWLLDVAAAVLGLQAEREAYERAASGDTSTPLSRLPAPPGPGGLTSVGGQVTLNGFIPKVPEPDW